MLFLEEGRRVPEFQDSDEPRHPFPTDVWYLGRAIQQNFLLVITSLAYASNILILE